MHQHTWGSDAGQEAEEARGFSEYLLRIGNGREPTYDDIGEGINRVPDDMLEPSQTLKGLISEIYGNLAHRHQNKQYMSERTILTLKNRGVDSITAPRDAGRAAATAARSKSAIGTADCQAADASLEGVAAVTA